MKPVEASLVGSATVWLALGPATGMAPGRSALVRGRAWSAFLSRVAPSSEYFSTTAASPYLVPSCPSPPSGSGAVPERSAPTPPGLVHDAVGTGSHPSTPKRCSAYRMRASDWLKTESGSAALATAAFRVQPPASVVVVGAGQPVPDEPWYWFGMPPTWLTGSSVAAHGAASPGVWFTAAVVYAQVLPVGSLFPLPPEKKPFCVGISWSSPC